MFVEFSDTVPATKPPAGARLVSVVNGESEAQRVNTKPNEQTGWMLAVRDQRDKAAFARLFGFYAPRLKASVLRSGIAASQAEEVVQEVMLAVWHKAAQFDPERAQVSAWIYQIARNRQIDIVRKEGRPVPEALQQEPEREPDASTVLAVEQESGLVREALGRLSEDQRGILEQAYFGELTHKQIGEATGLPLGTIKSRIRLGLERLRYELKDLREE